MKNLWHWHVGGVDLFHLLLHNFKHLLARLETSFELNKLVKKSTKSKQTFFGPDNVTPAISEFWIVWHELDACLCRFLDAIDSLAGLADDDAN